MYFVAIIFYQKQRAIAINRYYVKSLKFNNFLFESKGNDEKFFIKLKS